MIASVADTNVSSELLSADIVNPRAGGKIGVIGALPGIGTSTIAINLATQLATESSTSCCLTELGSNVPYVAIALNLTPQHTVEELAAEWPRVDAELLKGAASTSTIAHLKLLARRPDDLLTVRLASDAMMRLTETSAHAFSTSVFDLGTTLTEEIRLAVQSCDRLVIVTQANVSAIRRTKLLLGGLDRLLVPTSSIFLLLNRNGQRGEMPIAQVREVFVGSKEFIIPEAPYEVNQAMLACVPAAKMFRKSKFAKQLLLVSKALQKELPCLA